MHTTPSQYHLPESGKQLADTAQREGGEAHFPDPRVRTTIAVAVSRIDPYDPLLGEVALSITRSAQAPAGQTVSRRQSVPGSGQLLALVLLSEIHDRARCPRGHDCVASCRVGNCATEANGKGLGTAGKKSGTVP